MFRLINKIYKKDKVTLDLNNAVKIKLTSIENKINDLYKQIFLDYTTWYLEINGSEMGQIDDLGKRRAYVRTKLLGTGTATNALFKSTANTVPRVKVSLGRMFSLILVVVFHRV